MAKMIVASSSSCKTHIPPTLSASKPKQQPQVTLSIPKFRLPKPLASLSMKSLPLLAAAVSSARLAQPLPTLAVKIEKAVLFDFNMTLLVIMGEFPLLMFGLDKIYFSPLGRFMDKRDASIREKLSSVKDTSAEVKQLEEQAAMAMRATLSKMKKETQVELKQKLLEGRRKVEAELQEALATLESQKEQTIKALDSQIAVLSQDIVNKVLPIK